MIGIIAFTAKGNDTAGRVRDLLIKDGKEAVSFSGRDVTPSAWTAEHFRSDEALIFVGACGIAVRLIAPHIRDKRTDPAVLVLDEKAQNVIPILSGHTGGANALAERIAHLMGARAVITTATDVNALPAVDVIAKENGMVLPERDALKAFSAALLACGEADLYVPAAFRPYLVTDPLPECFSLQEEETAGREEVPLLVLSPEKKPEIPFTRRCVLHLIPRCVAAGIGCRRGKDADTILKTLGEALSAQGLSLNSVGVIASADLKREEAGILEAARRIGAETAFYSAAQLMEAEGSFPSSEFVRKTTGADNVCERAAVLAGAGELSVRRFAADGVTCAAGPCSTRSSLMQGSYGPDGR